MCNLKKLFLLLIAVTLVIDGVQCKKKKLKRPKKNPEEGDDSGVVTYPSFGFRDNENPGDFRPSALNVNGNFKGMPSNDPETTTMGLYAPAFPTAEDTTPFNIFDSNGQVSQSFSPYLSNLAPSNNQDPDKYQSMFNDYRTRLQAYDDLGGQSRDHSSQQDFDVYDQNMGGAVPVYGTKLNAKDATKKPSLYADSLNYESIYSYASTWPTTNADNLEDMKPSSSSYKTSFKAGPPASDFTNYKGTFHTDFSDNTYAYPTPSTESKDSYQTMKNSYKTIKDSFSTASKDAYREEPFSMSSKETYQNMKDVYPTSPKEPNVKEFFPTSAQDTNMKNTFLTSSKDPYSFNNMEDQFPTNVKDTYVKNTFSTNSREPYQNTKETFATSVKDPYQNAKGPFSTNIKSYQNMKDAFSSNSFSFGHSPTSEEQGETLDYTDKDTAKPTVNIIPNSYKKIRSYLNYSDPKYNFKNTDLYTNYKDQFKPNPVENSTTFTFNSLNFHDWKGNIKPNENYATIKDSGSKHNDNYSGMKNAYSLPEYAGAQSSIESVIDFTGDNNPFKDPIHNMDFANIKDPRFKDAIDFTKIKTPYSNIDYGNSETWKPPKTKMPSDEALTKHFGFEFMNPTQNTNFHTSVPTATTNWGNVFKTYESSSPFHRLKKPNPNEDDGESIVHIPKNPQPSKYNFGKFGSGKTIEEWNKDVMSRFKSEEELLGLRNHDTSHPSYLPTYKLKEELNGLPNYASNFDYGSAIDKWRYSHLKSKNPNDLDPHPSDMRQSVRVPYPKPYSVEIPHPVIVPVPQPYPVRVPVPKPVAVPVVHEIRVPIERPVPYPVIKNVPYPVERPVPVPIEKPVPVPVMRPYPVPIPHVRPVFHHSRPRPHRDESESLGEPDFDHEEQYLQESRIRPTAERIHLRPARNRRARIRPRRPSAQARGQQRGTRRHPPRKQSSYGTYRRGSRPRGYLASHKSLDRHSYSGPTQDTLTRSSNPGGRHSPLDSAERNSYGYPGGRHYNPVHSGKSFTNFMNGIRHSGPVNGERYSNAQAGARYAPDFKDLTLEEPTDHHSHDDYFKYCQNNPLCYISSLKMPVLE